MQKREKQIYFCLLFLVADSPIIESYSKGPSINYVVSRGERGPKLPILLSKKTTKRGEGTKIVDIETS